MVVGLGVEVELPGREDAGWGEVVGCEDTSLIKSGLSGSGELLGGSLVGLPLLLPVSNS